MITTSKDWVSRYLEDGVYFPIPALSDTEAAAFRAGVEDFERTFEFRYGRAPRSSECGECHLNFDWARRLALHPGLLDIAEAVLGEDVLVHATTIFHKRPHSGTYVTWHQDGYFMRLDQPDYLSVWVALSDSTAENGCLRVVPGSHRNGRVAHGTDSVAERNLLASGLEVSSPVDEKDAADVVLRAGEVSLHHVNIVHGSNPNHSSTSRIGFAIRYVAPHVRQAAPHYPVVLGRGHDNFGGFRHHTDPAIEDMEKALEAHMQFCQELAAIRRASGRRT